MFETPLLTLQHPLMLERHFMQNDPSLESQWRAIILFGKNSATYKFAFAKSLLEFVEQGKTHVKLTELAEPFSRYLCEHLKTSDKQGNATSSRFLDTCRAFNNHQISQSELIDTTERLGFVNVIDAFQNINGGTIPNLFYEKNFSPLTKSLVLKDSILSLSESPDFKNFSGEAEARWNLVETAWNLNINPSLLEVQFDEEAGLFFVKDSIFRRKNISKVRDSLSGYQKGRCFYSNVTISLSGDTTSICHVDHVLPRAYIEQHLKSGANIDGVWNLVLADPEVNNQKRAKTPPSKFLDSLYNRNEYYILSKHPLAETIINQTGKTPHARKAFLQKQYDISFQNSLQIWEPRIA